MFWEKSALDSGLAVYFNNLLSDQFWVGWRWGGLVGGGR
jgi:hypothetical protein